MGSGVLFYRSTIHNIYIKCKCFFLLSKTTFSKHVFISQVQRKERKREDGSVGGKGVFTFIKTLKGSKQKLSRPHLVKVLDELFLKG